MHIIKLFCIVGVFALLGTGVDATCGSTLTTFLTQGTIDINNALEYLYVSSPYNVSIEKGVGSFGILWNGTDAGTTREFTLSDQSANMTLEDGTGAPVAGPQPPRSTIVSTADRAAATGFMVALLGLAAMMQLRKGYAPLFIVIAALSMANLISSTVFSDAPCKDATITLQIPEAVVRFICVNDEPCVCGPGYTGDDCVLDSAPEATPVAAPVNPPVNSPMLPPVAQPTCSDATQNGDETDVDCGGSKCAPCSQGDSCIINNDCDSSVCSSLVCQQPTCSDGTTNGEESDKDCGGICNRCFPGKSCHISDDCDSDVCTDLICQEPACNDQAQNGAETDVDCGGGTCSKCSNGQNCQSDLDCNSQYCSPESKCDT